MDPEEQQPNQAAQEAAQPQQPIIPVAPKLIQFRTMLVADGVVITHDVGIVDVVLPELMATHYPDTYNGHHPDLIGAALLAVDELSHKYRGE